MDLIYIWWLTLRTFCYLLYICIIYCSMYNLPDLSTLQIINNNTHKPEYLHWIWVFYVIYLQSLTNFLRVFKVQIPTIGIITNKCTNSVKCRILSILWLITYFIITFVISTISEISSHTKISSYFTYPYLNIFGHVFMHLSHWIEPLKPTTLKQSATEIKFISICMRHVYFYITTWGDGWYFELTSWRV